jgi:hypothetical protein
MAYKDALRAPLTRSPSAILDPIPARWLAVVRSGRRNKCASRTKEQGLVAAPKTIVPCSAGENLFLRPDLIPTMAGWISVEVNAPTPPF